MPRCNVIPRDYVSQDRLESICFGVATYETKRIEKRIEKLLNQNRRCPHAGRLAAHNRHVDETRDAPLLSDWNEARPIRRGGHPNNLANFVSGWLPVQSYGLAIKKPPGVVFRTCAKRHRTYGPRYINRRPRASLFQ